MENKLQKGLSLLGFADNKIPTLESKLNAYIKELRLFNSAYNLVNTDDYDELVVNHILDSLSAYNEIALLAKNFENPVIADIGSGGGLPGIPLSIVAEDLQFTLIERMSKRCAFLENVKAILSLSNVTIQNLEAEKVPSGSIDIAVFRAFRPLDNKMTKTLLALLSPNGKLAAYKAKKDKIAEEMNAISNLVKSYEVKKLEVPFLDDRERNLVIIN